MSPALVCRWAEVGKSGAPRGPLRVAEPGPPATLAADRSGAGAPGGRGRGAGGGARLPHGLSPAVFSNPERAFEGPKSEPAPDVVSTHRRRGHHQDHRRLAYLIRNAFRDAAVLEYDMPKHDPDLGNPNLFASTRAGGAGGHADAGFPDLAAPGRGHAPESPRGSRGCAGRTKRCPLALRRGLPCTRVPLVAAHAGLAGGKRQRARATRHRDLIGTISKLASEVVAAISKDGA